MGRLVKITLLLTLIALGAWRASVYVEQTEMAALHDNALHRLDLYEGAVTSALTRFDYLPGLLNLNPDIVTLLRHPGDAALTTKVNRYLEAVNADAHLDTLYVMGLDGTTLAASNWNTAISFVNANFSFRPYFIEAMQSGHGTFYGLGTTSKQPGYYYAEPIYADGKPIGIATVKINLDKIESDWKQSIDIVLVADAHGVVFLTSVPEWKFKALHPLTPHDTAVIADTRQYDAPGALEPIGLHAVRKFDATTSIVALPPHSRFLSAARAHFSPEYLLIQRAVSGTSWHIMMLSNIAPVGAAARNAALDTALVLGLLAVAVLYLMQRRRIISQRLAMEATLQRLNDDLERKVIRRTEALSHSNHNLRAEITRHRQTEATLKATLEELVQAGKMAALGQMSTGITHELNQPLTALRTLSDNARMLLQRGRIAETQENLRVIGDLIERMGKITAQLRRFARKSPSDMRAVPIGLSVANALFLIEPRLRKEGVTLEYVKTATSSYVFADANRLEQVLINLFANALDAMAHSERRQLTVIVQTNAEQTTITIGDTGPGISEFVQTHLFEPFFTTKEQGAGLGLGLTISEGIVREVGGTLRGGQRPGGGAEFTIILRTAAHDAVIATA